MAATIDQTRPDQTRPDQTRLDHYSAFEPFKSFLRKRGIQKRIAKILLLWPLESALSRVIPPAKKICVIRQKNQEGGLMCLFKEVLGGIAYAERKNMIPVVDMRTLPNTLLQPDEVGHVNAWEYYFRQPAGIELDEALAREDSECLLVPAKRIQTPYQDAPFFHNAFGQLSFWRRIYRKYIRFTPEVLERFGRMKSQHEGKRILGILVRGTDYVTTRPPHHPIPPTAEQAIAKAREVMQEKHFDAVYLATEDKRILVKFQEAFGDKLILPEAQYVDYDYNNTEIYRNYLYNYHTDRENDRYLSGMEYLVSMLFLSRCEGLINSGNNGSVATMIFSEGFEYFYFFDFGSYI